MSGLFGSVLPVWQAPMAGSQDERLAAAVGEAGGMGAVPGALVDAEALGASLARLRASGDRPFNVNFFCHELPGPDAAREADWRVALGPYYREAGLDPAVQPAAPLRRPFDAAMAAVVEAIRPAVVSFHFGLPPQALLSRVRGAGARIVASATTVDEARWLEAQGVDAVIAQGLEAGGHRGHFMSMDLTRQAGTWALLPQVVAAVRVPVIAAGGIADARTVAAALALGAAAVQVGTAYLCCPEATTSPVHRAALQGRLDGVDPRHTALTRLFSGRPARGIVNRLMRELDPLDPRAPAFPYAAAALAPLRGAAERRGRGDFSPLWAGQNTHGCRERPAGELTRALAGLA
jgi:nitronate monooxygenase